MYSKLLLSAFILFSIIGCKQQNNPTTEDEAITSKSEVEIERMASLDIPYLTYKQEQVFPGNGSLMRPEDGVALADGRIIVGDQSTGLKVIETDGSVRAFGDFKTAGFIYNPPNEVNAPNGIFLEHDGEHLLMCDLSDGKIFRINIASEAVSLVYDHPYGVNSVYRDKTGAIWFSQSTVSTNMAELFVFVNEPAPNGRLFRMADLESEPSIVADSFYLANGIYMDRAEENLYVAETMMDRVHRFKVNLEKGTLNYDGVAAHVGSPDNIMIDADGRLLAGSALYNQVLAFDFEKHSSHIIFDGSTAKNRTYSEEWNRRRHLGLAAAEVITADLFAPLPGLLTGMFFSVDGKTLYICNLGNDLLKIDYE